MKSQIVLLNLMRLGAALQIIVGVGLWTGHWLSLVGTHRIIGLLYVFSFWTIAAISLVQRRAPALAGAAILWGVVIVGFGLTQVNILPGAAHWVVRVLHLIVGLSALPMAERLTHASVREAVA